MDEESSKGSNMDPLWDGVLKRLERIMEQAERFLVRTVPPPVDSELFVSHWAFRWERVGDGGRIVPVEHPHLVDLADLVGIDHAKDTLVRNTEQFVSGYPANNVLLWGERGNGKSSCVKGLLPMFAPRGLRLVEVQRWDLLSFPAIVNQLRDNPFRFILFCDDLSFDEREADYRGLKTLLDGGIEARPENVLIYATSNRRHLMPESMADNIGGTEIHPEEAVSEKLSLSDRFGLSIGFTPFDQETYLSVVQRYVEKMSLPVEREAVREEAFLWALYGGRRNGRAARQFVDDLVGRLKLNGARGC